MEKDVPRSQEELTISRFDFKKTIDGETKAEKLSEKARLEALVREIEGKFLSNGDWQACLKDETTLKLGIQEKYVELQLLNAEVGELDEGRKLLEKIKEEVTQEKKDLEL
jgi:hypothetical protein